MGEATLGDQARDLTMPSPKCPGSLSGESHQDGTAVGSAAWAIRQAVGQEKGDAIVWGGVAMLKQGASFADLAEWITKTAEQFATDGKIQPADVDAIKTILANKTLTTCSRVLPLAADKPIKSRMIGIEMMGWIFGGLSCDEMQQYYGASDSTLFQFEYKPAPEDEGVRFQVSLGGGGSDWGIYASRNEPVYFAGGNGEMFRPDTYEYSATVTNKNSAELVIDKNSNPPFDPKMSFVMVVGSANCQGTTVTVTASATVSIPDAGPEAGPEAGKDAAPDVKKESGLPLFPDSGDAAASALDNAEVAGGSCACSSAGTRAADGRLLSIAAIAALAGVLRKRVVCSKNSRKGGSHALRTLACHCTRLGSQLRLWR